VSDKSATRSLSSRVPSLSDSDLEAAFAQTGVGGETAADDGRRSA
jgi:hypothetical protein